MPRIAPAEPPYEPEIATALERIMPPGVPPLVMFRTMARSPRVFAKLFAGVYALYCGVVFIATVGLVLAPVGAHVLRRFHLDKDR